jgi:hypothetical protein
MVLNTINLKIAKNKISTVKFVVFSCESTLHENIDIEMKCAHCSAGTFQVKRLE